jgi:FkbM family methyltransferase
MQRVVGGLEPEMRLLDRLMTPNGIAVDVGANYGIYAYALAAIASKVHCIEPLSECCAYIKAFPSDKITVHNCALSDAAGTLRLHIPTIQGRSIRTRASLEEPSGTFDIRDVEVRTLDSFDLPRVDFIKIDVEGVEAAALRGARATIEKHRPSLLIEIGRERHSRQSFDEVIGWLTARGYQPHVLGAEGLRASTDPWTDAATHVNFVFPRP